MVGLQLAGPKRQSRSTRMKWRRETRNSIIVWLIVVPAFHVLLTSTLLVVGRLGLFPTTIDAQGILTSFASDGIRYRTETIELSSILLNSGIKSWLQAPFSFHVKLYSLPAAALGPVFGFNILAVEPLNALYFTCILYFAYQIGELLFSQRAGLISSIIMAVWPSFVLHTTQPLKDLVIILLWLALTRAAVGWLVNTPRWRDIAIAGMPVILTPLIWLIRPDMWILVELNLGLAILFIIVRQVIARRFFWRTLAPALFLGILITTVPRMAAMQSRVTADRQMRVSKASSIAELMTERRLASVVGTPVDAASNLDSTITFRSTSDIVQYLPRAVEIGLFAPFPNMWFARETSVGAIGRTVAGVEMCIAYLLELLAVGTMFRRCRCLASWFLFIVAMTGITALGFVVINIGTLYRFRYPFFIIVIILASDRLVPIFRDLLAITDLSDQPMKIRA